MLETTLFKFCLSDNLQVELTVWSVVELPNYTHMKYRVCGTTRYLVFLLNLSGQFLALRILTCGPFWS